MDLDVATDARLRIALVCRPEILRLGLERVLAHNRAFDVVAHRRPEGVRGPVDVAVICERELGDVAGVCAASAQRLDAGLVLVAARTDPNMVLDCLAAGATGLLLEGDSAADLCSAARAAAVGEYHLGPLLLTALLDWQRSERRRPPSTHEAELGLLSLMAGGRTTEEIAGMLGVSPKTVRNRASLLYRRLGVRSRAQAVQVAEARGLLDSAG